jgi:hypothetical protein
MTKRLLILACSARKRTTPDYLPAIDRYDGSLWRVVRRYGTEHPLFAHDLDIYALSAKYGLIPATQPIPWYEQKMTTSLALGLRPEVRETLWALFIQQSYASLCFGLSRLYRQALEGWEEVVPSSVPVTHTDGPIGMKQAQLRAWLHDDPPPKPADRPLRLPAPTHAPGKTTLCGVTLTMSREEVLANARQGIKDEPKATKRYRNWYVMVDEHPVAVKWLVSRISGLPPSRFDAGRARQVLLALGIDIERMP